MAIQIERNASSCYNKSVIPKFEIMIDRLNDDEIEQVLHQNFIGRIGCHADGQTYIVPVSYAYHELYIYVRSFEGMKVNIMRENPAICFEVDVINDMSNWQCVIGWGMFEELTDPEDRNHALRILMGRKLPALSSINSKLSSEWPFATKDYDSIPGVLFKILLKEKTGRYELNTDTYSFIA